MSRPEFPYAIYSVRHRATGREYIGCTAFTVAKRWAGWRSAARCGAPLPLAQAIAAHGEDAFDVEQVASAVGETNGHITETRVIRQRGTLYPRGFNRHPGIRAYADPAAFDRYLSQRRRPTGALRQDAA